MSYALVGRSYLHSPAYSRSSLSKKQLIKGVFSGVFRPFYSKIEKQFRFQHSGAQLLGNETTSNEYSST